MAGGDEKNLIDVQLSVEYKQICFKQLFSELGIGLIGFKPYIVINQPRLIGGFIFAWKVI